MSESRLSSSETKTAQDPATRAHGRHPVSLWRTGLLIAAIVTIPGTVLAQSFGPVAFLNTNSTTDSAFDWRLETATDGEGNWVAVWDTGEILTARSSDNGATWTAPAVLSSLSNDELPDIATDGLGTWIVVWSSDDSLAATIGDDPDILYVTSTDLGATWSAPQALNTNAATDPVSFDEDPDIATDGAGTWVAAWSIDEPGGVFGTDVDVFAARSTDAGVTWSAPTPLNSAATDSGTDAYPEVRSAGAGTWIAAWHSTDSLGGTIGTDLDILFARSTDGGTTWTAPSTLNSGAATDTGNDSVPHVVSDGAGNSIIAWDSNDDLGGTIGTDLDVLYARSDDSGATWTSQAPLNTSAASDALASDFSVRVAADGLGNWAAIWQSTNDLGGTIFTDSDILISRSINAGATWTAPSALASNAATDGSSLDFVPSLTSDNSGNWVAGWTTTYGGGDRDLLFSVGQSAAVSVPTLGMGASAALGLLLLVSGWVVTGRSRGQSPFGARG